MGNPNSLLGNARAFAKDFPRDGMPQGFLWDVVDYVPAFIDSTLTGRGGWKWASPTLGETPGTDATDDAWAGISASFPDAGDKLLVQGFYHKWFDIGADAASTHYLGPANFSNQNPVQLVDTVIQCSEEDAVPQLITDPGGVLTVTNAHSSAPHARRSTVYKSMLVMGAAPGEEDVVRFSVPGENLATAAAYDANSFLRTSRDITALTALRGMVLVFHKNSVERIRGSTPPYSPDQKGDMFLELALDRIGCSYPRTVATWNENVIFADEHGVHMTDGTIVRNIAAQGNILSYWRNIYDGTYMAAACTFLDYYIITLRYSDVASSVTLVCDLNRRQWFRFSNIRANTYIVSAGGVENPYVISGTTGASTERLWAGQNFTARLIQLESCFFPTLELHNQQDDDGTPVLPNFETSWYRLGQEGRKRVRFGYLSYDAPIKDEGLARTASLPRPVLELGYMTSPQQDAYTIVGELPETRGEYTRFRFPVGKFPYGIAFRVRQTHPTAATRIYDLEGEAQPAERSRI